MFSASSELANVPVTTSLHRQIVDLICVFVYAISVSSSCFLARSFSKAAKRNSMPGVFGMAWWSSLTINCFFPCTFTCSFYFHAFVFASFSCLACQSVFSISFRPFGHCFTSNIRNMSDSKLKEKNTTKKSVHLPWPVGLFSLLIAPACITHRMVWDLTISTLHNSGTCQTKTKTHKNNLHIFHGPLVVISLVCTSMCLLHMVWGITSFMSHILQAPVSSKSIVFPSGWITAFRLSYKVELQHPESL